MEIVFLGTSCMVPTKERNHQAIFVSYKEEGLLVDCGEGTQRQFKIANIKPTKITKILLTHWHGDHVLGLPGLLQTLNASDYEHKMDIYGPIGTKEKLSLLFKAFAFAPVFEYSVTEFENEGTINLKDLSISVLALEHSVPCLGYSIKEKDRRRIKVSYITKKNIPDGPLLGELQEGKNILWKGEKISPDDATYVVKGKKLAIILDTIFCNNSILLAKDADLLISEAVYSSDLLNKAEEYKHMTATQTAELAQKANVGKLVLTHFSQRYKTTEAILEEAKLKFSDVVISHDFMKLKI